jgi:modulator of FtsH protease HflC
MSLRALIVGIVALAFAAWLGSQCLYTVDQGSAALLVRLGQVVDTIEEPGLYFKAPLIDTVTQYDKRLLPLEPPVDQIILGDQKRIVVQTFARFRINSPLRFYETVGTLEQARVNLSQMIGSTLRKQLGKAPLSALLTPEREKITAEVRDEAAVQADALGVQLVDVRLLRADLPTETSQAIYERMTSERVREANDLRAQGSEWGQEIRAKADRERVVLLSEARRESEISRGGADAEASRILADAYAQDPDFFDLYRTLQVYRSGLTAAAPTLLLSPSSELMRFFDGGPLVKKPPATDATAPPPAPEK